MLPTLHNESLIYIVFALLWWERQRECWNVSVIGYNGHPYL